MWLPLCEARLPSVACLSKVRDTAEEAQRRSTKAILWVVIWLQRCGPKVVVGIASWEPATEGTCCQCAIKLPAQCDGGKGHGSEKSSSIADFLFKLVAFDFP